MKKNPNPWTSGLFATGFALIGLGLAIPLASAQTLLTISHDGTSADEVSPFDTIILSQGSNWTYTTDGARSVMTAVDNNTSTSVNGGDNRLILIQEDGVSEFTDTGTAADKGWVFEVELKFLAGESQSAGGDSFASFGVRSENGAGKQAWVGLNEKSQTIGWLNSNGDQYGSAALDVSSLIGDGNYHNFIMHKYDASGTTNVDVYMDGGLVLSTAYASLNDDINIGDIQGFASGTPVPLSEVNVDFINFTLYDNLTDSIPDDGSDPMLVSTSPADNAPSVQPSADLVANFDEAITLGATGDVTIKNLTNPSDTVISLGGADPDGTLTLTGVNQLTIDPTADLVPGDEYAVQIGGTVVEDALGNTYAGIADTTTWSFTVVAPSSTVAYWQFDSSSSSPGLADSVGSYDLSVVSGTFSANATAAVNPVPNPDATGGFAGDSSANPDAGVANASLLLPGSSGQEYLNVPSDPGDVFNLSGKSFTFEGWFQHDTGSTPGGFGDFIGGTRNAGGFRGYLLKMQPGGTIQAYFTDGTAWTVETAGTDYRSDTEFHHFALVWEDGAGDNSTGFASIYIDGNLEASGSAPVGWSAATADGGDQAFIVGGRGAGSDNTWDGRFDEFRFSDVALSPSEFLQPPITDTAPPQITSLLPADGASNVAIGANLVATFDEPITLKSGGTITITDTDDGSGTQVINLLDAARASVSGNELTIVPASDLEFDTNYEIVIASNAIEDQATSPNAYPGTAAGEWTFTTVAEILPPAVLADINADGTNRTGTTADFEAATGLAVGTFSGDAVLVFGGTEEGGTYTETVSNVTLAITDKSGGADGWFGAGTDNNLLDDGFFNTGTTPQTITLSGSGLGLTANRSYQLYLFAGRSQGHDTTFTFDPNDPEDPSLGASIDVDPPVVGGDNTLGTALFTFDTTAAVPSSLVIEWGAHAPGVDPVFAGFALRDIGAANTPYVSWIAGFDFSAFGSPNLSGTGNPEGDSLNNLLEFAFGTDPTVSDAASLQLPVSPATTGTNGVPIVNYSAGVLGVSFEFLFVRRTDYATSGITYTPQFSNDLNTWYDSTVSPGPVVDTTPGYGVVSVPYPAILPNGRKARFARMKITATP